MLASPPGLSASRTSRQTRPLTHQQRVAPGPPAQVLHANLASMGAIKTLPYLVMFVASNAVRERASPGHPLGCGRKHGDNLD